MPENHPKRESQSPSKAQKLHYRLTNEEWVQAVRTLKPAEKDVLYYLRTLDPFGDRYLEIGVREMARILDYDPGTISRALKSLDAKHYINLDLLRVGVRIRTRRPGQPHLEAVSVTPLDPSDLSAETDPKSKKSGAMDPELGCCFYATLLSPRNTHDPDATLMILRQHLLSTDNTWPLKALSCKDSRTPQTIHTIQTLLNKKRERSEKFSTGQGEANEPEPIPQDSPPGSEATESPPPPQEPPEGTKRSAAAEDEFFDWVLTYKVPRLPQRPASPRSAAKGWIEKHREQLYAEYRTWLAGPQRGSTDPSGTPPPPRLPPPVEEDPDDRLRRYQALWQNPVCRNGIRKAIEDNPDWNLTIGPDGPQEKPDDDPEPNPN